MFLKPRHSINERIVFSEIENSGVSLSLKREDTLHPIISGNKFRKLKYNLQAAKSQNKHTLLTFGGAHSNHLVATAAAGMEHNFKTIGIVRGEELVENYRQGKSINPTLDLAIQHQMILSFVSRANYRNKTTPEFLNSLKEKFGEFYLIPEGGTNRLAVKGCEEIVSKNDDEFDIICAAVGTGGTISGIINSAANHQKIMGFPALKGDFLRGEINKYVLNNENWSLYSKYHFGGFAKISKELITFINQFKNETGIPLDPIYTGKMMYGIIDLIKKDYFKKGTKVLAIHTGGLQGIKAMNAMLKKKNSIQLT
jgi:1-aminocyclopropane-1-carboxylate deaminase